ncbi:MAG TPA: hypothetical protein VFF70_04835 [Anaerolineae bacterium]|nr:hypothetical protein [Anaerolineae bacterium]
MKIDRFFAFGSILLTSLMTLAIIRQLSLPAPRSITPTLTGKQELCLTCHYGIEEISKSHPVEAFGCVSCHGGDPLALDKQVAHTGLRGGKNPADFSAVEASCGGSQCHSGSIADNNDHIQRSTTSIQATYAGGIVQVRRAFGAQSDAVARFGIDAITSEVTPTDRAVTQLDRFDPVASNDPQAVIEFGQRCLNCHLSSEPIMQPYAYRSTGCAACHVTYASDGLYRGGDPTIDPAQPGHASLHQLTTKISYTTCNTCHNRGNYSLKQMTFLPRNDLPTSGSPLPEDRLRDYYQPIAQFTKCEWELGCIDCHTSKQVMGDGQLYSSKLDIQHTQCKTCHGTLTELPQTTTITDPNDVELRRAQLNGNYSLQVGDKVIAIRADEKFGAIKLINGQYIETMKVSGQSLVIPLATGSLCKQRPDQQSSNYCHECHAVKR